MTVQSLAERLAAKARASHELPSPSERREIRCSANVTRCEAAEYVGVHARTIALWESGLVEPSPRHITKYAELLDLLNGGSACPAAA